MDRDAEKEKYERGIFLTFLQRTGLKVKSKSIRHGVHYLGEPDILCQFENGGNVGFELGRLTDSNLKKVLNRWEPKNGEIIITGDPSEEIAIKKISASYNVDHFVELLLYKEDPIISTDDMIISAIKPICQNKHGYFRVWYMGNAIEVLYENS